MNVNWHKIIFNENINNFVGELPKCDEKTGEVDVLITYEDYHYKCRNTNKEKLVIDGRKVCSTTFRKSFNDNPNHFLAPISREMIVAWAYLPTPYLD